MRPRYLLAIATDRGQLGGLRSRFSNGAGPAGVRIILDGSDLLLMGSGRDCWGFEGSGAIIGPIHRSGRAIVSDRSMMEIARETRGRSLIEGHWGGYIAIILGPGRIEVVRAPLGDLPCYWTKCRGLHLLGSDLALLRTAGMKRPAIDAAALVRHLLREDLRTSETCLGGVRELRGGERMTLEGFRAGHSVLWSPWTFTDRERQINEPAEAARMVRAAALDSVSARAAPFGRILLKLSGGLDSSIVAACLKQSGAAFSALNLVTGDPAGDERAHSSIVARALRIAMVERYRDPARVLLRRSGDFRVPRPAARAFTQESRRIAGEVAEQLGSEAVFDGGGGDNIFCSLQSARPAADCLAAGGFEQFRETSTSIARLAQASIWRVAGRALRLRLRRRSAYQWPADTRFLSVDAASEADKAFVHPWLQAPDGTLPGKAAHVALIAAAQSVAEGFDAEDELPAYSPLISQPLIETSLRVPSWLWFERGLNRAVARRAFSECLPMATIERRSKGAPDCFIADLYETNRGAIREMLMEGALRKEAMLDTVRLERVLDDEAPVEGHDYLRIMQLVDAEAWAQAIASS